MDPFELAAAPASIVDRGSDSDFDFDAKFELAARTPTDASTAPPPSSSL